VLGAGDDDDCDGLVNEESCDESIPVDSGKS